MFAVNSAGDLRQAENSELEGAAYAADEMLGEVTG
jgi:hypothetical protein